MRIIALLFTLFTLQGCTLLDPAFDSPAPVKTSTGTYLCETNEALDIYQEFCQVWAWSEFLIDADKVTWSERNDRIKLLGLEPKQTLKKILLSQGIETPYTHRLRAQNWLAELKPTMDAKMAEVLRLLIEEPSQQMLELESAISILSKVNARQEKSIVDLQETVSTRTKEIIKQRDQVEQLLKIEANMSDNKRSN